MITNSASPAEMHLQWPVVNSLVLQPAASPAYHITWCPDLHQCSHTVLAPDVSCAAHQAQPRSSRRRNSTLLSRHQRPSESSFLTFHSLRDAALQWRHALDNMALLSVLTCLGAQITVIAWHRHFVRHHKSPPMARHTRSLHLEGFLFENGMSSAGMPFGTSTATSGCRAASRCTVLQRRGLGTAWPSTPTTSAGRQKLFLRSKLAHWRVRAMQLPFVLPSLRFQRHKQSVLIKWANVCLV